MHGIPQAPAQLMADTFYALIFQEMSKDYEMVSNLGQSTLRAQIAITCRAVLA
jgi:hypothetical protein